MCLCVWGDHRMETLNCHRVPGVVVEHVERMERSEYCLVLRGCGSEGLQSWGSCTCIFVHSAGVITGQTTLVVSGRWGREPGLDTGEVRDCVVWLLEEAGSPSQTRDRHVCAGGWWYRSWLLNRLGIWGQFREGYIMYMYVFYAKFLLSWSAREESRMRILVQLVFAQVLHWSCVFLVCVGLCGWLLVCV